MSRWAWNAVDAGLSTEKLIGLLNQRMALLGGELLQKQDDLRFVVMNERFGAQPGGVRDCTQAFQDAVDEAGNGNAPMRVIFVPSNLYKIAGRVNITHNRTHFLSYGPYGVEIDFSPGAHAECFQFANGVNPVYQCSMQGFSFASADTTNQKVAVDCVDTSEMYLDNITTLNWTGNTSIGVRSAGRELSRFKNLSLSADRPLHFLKNPNFASLSVDHFHISDVYCLTLGSTESAYLIDGDVGLANLTVDGKQAIVGGKYAFKFSFAGSPVTALIASISNLRFEGAAVSTGYAVSWECPAYSLTLNNCNLGSASGGLYVRNVLQITQENCLYTGTGQALNLDSTCDRYWQRNTFQQDSSTVVITGLEEMFALPQRGINAPLPQTCYYGNSSTAIRLVRVGQGMPNASLPAGATLQNGSVGFDTTNNRLVFYVGGNRYYVAGTAF